MLNTAFSLINPGELESYLEQEKEKRKKARLVQVRSQSREIAQNIRQAVDKERDHQLHLLGQKKKQEFLEAAENKLEHLRSQYSNCFNHIGEAHESVKIQEQLKDLLNQKSNINSKIADNRGKAALFQLHQFQDQMEQEDFKTKEKRKEILNKEKNRASKIAKAPKRPVDPINEYEYTLHKNPIRKGKPISALAKNQLTVVKKRPPNKQSDDDKENGFQDNGINLKSHKNRPKRRVSVGFKSQKTKGGKTKPRIIHECDRLPSVLVTKDETASQDARKLAEDLNTAMSNEVELDQRTDDRFKHAMNKIQAEKNVKEVMKTLEKMEKMEKSKQTKLISEENWKTAHERQEEQLHMEKLVEDMMRVDIVKTPAAEEADSGLSLLNDVVMKPEIIKIATPRFLVHNSPELIISPGDLSSPEDFKRTPELVVVPPYMNRSPKPRWNDASSTMRLRPFSVGRIQWQPRKLTPAYRLEDHQKARMETPKNRRRSNVHRAVVTQQLIKHFLEFRGVQSPMKKAFTKSYVEQVPEEIDLEEPAEPELVVKIESPVRKQILHPISIPEKCNKSPRFLKYFPPLRENEDEPVFYDKDNSSDSRVTWAAELINANQLETSLSNKSDDSLTKEIKKVEAKEVKIFECSKDVQRITEEQRKLQEQLEDVRRMRHEIENKQRHTEEELEAICNMEDDCYEDYSDDDDSQNEQNEDEIEEQESNVTIRRRRCPTTVPRGMNVTPHELSTIAELDSPRNSSVRFKSLTPPLKSTPLRMSQLFVNEPGILEEPQISLIASDTFCFNPSPVKNAFKMGKYDELSPLSQMLQQLKNRQIVASPKLEDEAAALSPLDASLTDSLMSFQRHELSAYNDIEADFSPGISPNVFRRPRSLEPIPVNDTEIEEIIRKWRTKAKSN